MKQLSFVVGLVLAAASGIASAQDGYSYQCTHYNDVRTIEVVYLQRESSVPCEVNYIKGDSQETIWNSRYTKGYCEAKAADFSKRQEEWGWSCKKVDGNTVAEAKTAAEPKK